MKKMPSLFKRNYDTDRMIRNEVVEGCEWVLAGEGVPTVKMDGTSCMIREGRLFKRYDRKVTKSARRRGRPFKVEDCKPAPPGWEACESAPNLHTGHWPGWMPVGEGPEDHLHQAMRHAATQLPDGTYELCGPRVQGNPHGLDHLYLIPHGGSVLSENPRTFEEIREFLERDLNEGIVWHHEDGRMVKIRRRDFGFAWPLGNK